MCARLNGEGEIMLSAGSRSRRGNLPIREEGARGREWVRVEGLVSCHRSHPPSQVGGYLIRGRKVGGNWGVGGVRLGT